MEITHDIARIVVHSASMYGLAWMGSRVIMISPIHAALFSGATLACSYIGIEIIKKTIGEYYLNTLKGRSLEFISTYAVPIGVIAYNLHSPQEVIAMLGLFSVSKTISTVLFGQKPIKYSNEDESMLREKYNQYVRPAFVPALCFGVAWMGKSVFLVTPLHCVLFVLSQKILSFFTRNYLLKQFPISSKSCLYLPLVHSFAELPAAVIFFGNLTTPSALITMIGIASLGYSTSFAINGFF